MKAKRFGGFILLGSLLVLAACSQQPLAGTGTQTTLAGVVGGTDGNLTLAGQPIDLSSATITENGDPVTATQAVGQVAIHPGMFIYAQGTDVGGKVKVSAADIQIEVRGQIESVDVANATLTVLGQTIAVDALTRIYEENPDGTYTTLALADLATGDYVKVSGTRQADGTVLATYIERKVVSSGGAPSTVEAKGFACNLDDQAKTFDLGADKTCTTVGPSVDYSSANANVSGTPTPDAFVEVKGTFDSAQNTITASKVEFKSGMGEHANVDQGKGEQAELFGPIASLDETQKTFTLAGYTVDYSQATLDSHGQLADGAYAEVKGQVDASDPTLIHATRVEVKYAHGGKGTSDGEVKGMVDSVDAADTTHMLITVGGMTFWADQDTIVKQDDPDGPLAFADIKAGDWVEVKYDSQNPDASGNPYATKIEVKNMGGMKGGMGMMVDLEGPVKNLDATNHTFEVSGYAVTVDQDTVYEANNQRVSANDFWNQIQNDDRVEVKGTDQGNNTVLAKKIELK